MDSMPILHLVSQTDLSLRPTFLGKMEPYYNKGRKLNMTFVWRFQSDPIAASWDPGRFQK